MNDFGNFMFHILDSQSFYLLQDGFQYLVT